MFEDDAPDNALLNDEYEEYEVGFEEAGANEMEEMEMEVLEMEPVMALESVDSQMNLDQDPLDGECIRNLFSENDDGVRGDENIEDIEIETLDDTGASATTVKNEELNLAMLDVSFANNETNESNSSDCVITATYYAYYEDRDEGDAD